MTKITGLDARILQIEENQRLLIQGFSELKELSKRVDQVYSWQVGASDDIFDIDNNLNSIRLQLDELHSDVDALSATDE